MPQQEDVISLKAVFKEFMESFYVPEYHDFLESLEDPLEGASLEEMLKIIETMKDKLEIQVGEMYKDSKLSKEQVDGYMTNPDNFSRTEWLAIEAFQRKAEDYTKEFQVASQGAGIRAIVKEGRERAHRRKSKLERLDNTKRNWIPM